VGKCSSGNVQQIQYGGGIRRQKYLTVQFRDRYGLKADNTFLRDAKYIIPCLTRELDIVPYHKQCGSYNRSNMAGQTGSTYISGDTLNIL